MGLMAREGSLASLTTDETTGSRSFELPIRGPLEGAPYQCPGMLRIDAENATRPNAVVATFFPSELEFNFHLSKLVKHARMPLDGASLSLQASGAQPVVHFEMNAMALAKLGELPLLLADLEGYVHNNPALLDWSQYEIAGVGFQKQD